MIEDLAKHTVIGEGRYSLYAADRSGNCWEIRRTDDPQKVLNCLKTWRAEFPYRVHGVSLADDPERGDVEIDIEEMTPEERHRVAENLCWRCGHADGAHDESHCTGGEDVLCRCDCFEDPRS